MHTDARGVEISVSRAGRELGSRCYRRSSVSVGSARESALRLRDDAIAARQAVIRVEGRSVMIANLGADPQGVCVNGRPVSTLRLGADDEVAVGPFRFRVSLLGNALNDDEATTTVRALAPSPKLAPAREEGTPPTQPSAPLALRDTMPVEAEPAIDDEDGYWDDDDDEEPFVEPFSLLESVVCERFKEPARVSPFARAEVIRYKDGEILDVSEPGPRGDLRLFPDDFKLLDTIGDGRARLYFHESFRGVVVRKGKARRLERLMRPETLLDDARALYAVDLQKGDYAQIVRDDAGYLVRFVHPPLLPKEKLLSGFSINWSAMQVLAGSTALHALILVLLGLTAPEAHAVLEIESERFAKVAMKDLRLEKPRQTKKPEPPPAPPKKTTIERDPARRVKRAPRPKRSARAAPSQTAARQNRQVKGMLTALRNFKPAQPGRSSLQQLTNIAAVRAPRGANGYKSIGTVGKIKGGVRLAGAFGTGRSTRPGAVLLADARIGAIAARRGTGTRVRARVRRAPRRPIGVSGGHLSQSAIQRVVNKHMRKVQACYERQLLTDPSLSGKIVFDWVIGPSGKVSSARQQSSTMRSTAVPTCVIRSIRHWRFPRPIGGSVTVRYPFVFRARAF